MRTSTLVVQAREEWEGKRILEEKAGDGLHQRLPHLFTEGHQA